MEVSRGGKFSHTIRSDQLSVGLRRSKRNPRNSGFMTSCQGAVGRDKVLQILDEISRLTTTVITDGFPYPQIFVFPNMIIVCSATTIYEYEGGALVAKHSTYAGDIWTAVAFHDYAYMSNNKVVVIRSAEDKTYSETKDLPINLAACNYNGQVVIYAPEVNPESSLSIGDHYWWQQSIDVIPDKICMIPMYNDYDDSDQAGILNIVYENGSWKSHGMVRGIAILCVLPNTCRITSVYEAYYCSCMDWDWDKAPEKDKFYLRLYIFEKGKYPRFTNVWESNWVTKTPYYVAEDIIHNVMDCVGDRIACIAKVLKVDNVTFNKYQIKVSNDAGLTFPTEWSFPTGLSPSMGGDYVQLRMSQDGIVWVAYLRYDTESVELWKSNAGATSWSKICEINYPVYLNGHRCYSNWSMDISNTDGQYISIRLLAGYLDSIYHQVTLSSSDYGISFTAHECHSADYSLERSIVANQQYITSIVKRKLDNKWLFMNSDDYGATLTENDVDPIPLTGDWIDLQGYNNEIVYGECGVSFYPGAPSGDFISALYSSDNGANWIAIQSPVQNTDGLAEQFIERE